MITRDESSDSAEPLDWRELSACPNEKRLTELRRQLLSAARRPRLIDDRVEYLCQLARGRKVLDVGCVEHQAAAAANPEWLHGRLAAAADECLGVDVLPDAVDFLRRAGHHVRCHDILTSPLDERFDLIVCGELIEHLDAPGRLLESVAAMLATDGEAVLTTPNPWYANVMLKNLLGRSIFVDSADHVAWFEPSVLLELGRRAGLRLTSFAGIAVRRPPSIKARLFFGLAPLWCALGVRREVFAKTMVYHFARIDPPTPR